MKITELVSCNNFLAIKQSKLCLWFITWLKLLFLNSLISYKNNPFNIMFREHRVCYRTYTYRNFISFNIYYWNMFFNSSISCSWNHFNHIFTTTNCWYT